MIKFGLVGCGPWGIKVAAAIKALGFECQPCNRNGAFNDYRRLVEWADIVWIAAHPGVHCEMARRALLTGKLTVVEKPVGFDAHEVKGLLDLSRANKVPFIVDYVHLFSPSLMRLKQDDLVHLKITMGGNGPARDYSPLWDYGSHAVAIALELADNRGALESMKVDELNGSSDVLCPPGERYLATLSFQWCTAEIDVSNALVSKFFRVEACRSPNYSLPTPFYEPTGNPLAALISTAARLHLRGEYWTNGALAVEVTDVLERLHAMLPK